MKRIPPAKIIGLMTVCCLWIALVFAVTAVAEKLPDGVTIRAIEGLTKVYAEPNPNSEAVTMAVDGAVYPVISEAGDFWQIKVVGDKKTTTGFVAGFVPKAHAEKWEQPVRPTSIPLIIGIVVLVVLAVAIGGALGLKSRKGAGEQRRLDSILDSMNRGEEHYRAGNYVEAISEYNRYLNQQGGEVRFPDVYRRLCVCHQKVGETRNAAKAWEKMRSLGGLKTMDDYTLGAEIMRALGQEDQAAAIFEELLDHERDDEKKEAIHRSLFEIYHRQRQPEGVVKHAIALMGTSTESARIRTDTIGFLIAEHQTAVAIASRNKDLIKAIGDEFLGDEIKTPEAEAVYKACVSLDPKNTKFHKILAELYKQEGSYKKAINQLTLLSALDKDNKEHFEEAARIYVENGLVHDALAEGNPQIIKKIAQIFLSHSEVTDAAIATYEKVIEFQPTAVGVNKMLATVYLTKGQTQKYMATLRMLVELDPPGKKEYLTQLAQCLIDNGLMEQTIKEGNRELNVQIIKQLIKRGAHDDQAISLFEKLIGYEPDNLQIRITLLKAYEKRGDLGNCLKHQVQLSTQKPKDEELAAKAVKFAIDNNLLDPVVRYGKGRVLNLGAVAVVKGNIVSDAAVALVEKALVEDPGNSAFRAYLDAQGKTGRASKSGQAQTVRQPSAIPKTIPKKSRPETSITERPSAPPKSPAPPPAPSPNRKVTAQASEVQAPKTDQRPSQAVAAPMSPSMMDFAGDDQAATFISVSEAASTRTDVSTAELFKPESGPMAYSAKRSLFTDGWGEWFAGEEAGTRKPVLLRVLKKNLLEPLLFEEFVRAATELGLTMAHPSILIPLERVKKGDGTQGFLYTHLPMNLAQAMESPRSPSLETKIAAASNIVDALAYAHNYRGRDGKIRRTFHLHLQPSEVMVTEDLSTCCLASLGFSQLYRNLTLARQPRWQDPGMNPAYLPPEFFRTRGGGTSERSADIYSLGALLYFMLSGAPPFDGPTMDDYKFQHSKATATPLGLSVANIPEWLDRLILKCLEKEPESRWDNITDIQALLRENLP